MQRLPCVQECDVVMEATGQPVLVRPPLLVSGLEMGASCP